MSVPSCHRHCKWYVALVLFHTLMAMCYSYSTSDACYVCVLSVFEYVCTKILWWGVLGAMDYVECTWSDVLCTSRSITCLAYKFV